MNHERLEGVAQLTGVAASPGIALGPALVVERQSQPVFRVALAPGAVEAEVERLTRAVTASREQLQALRERLSREVGLPHAYIFEAHLLMLEDPLLLERSLALVREEQVNAEWALHSVAEQLRALFEEFSDDYLRERHVDIDDVLGRIQSNLAGSEGAPSLARLPCPVVLVAADLSPSEAAALDWASVKALAIDAGSRTSHTVILARSLGVPAVVGLNDATRRVPPGALVAVDGTHGRVLVQPSAPSLDRIRVVQERDRQEALRLEGTRGLAAVTTDGARARLLANVEFPEEAATAVRHGAEGIGLFRSEYLVGGGRRWPNEEQQLEVYRNLLTQLHPHPVVVRTFDVGPGDLGPLGASSLNPALGERALRLLRREDGRFRDLLRTQLRALLRAAACGPLAIMFPFVAGPADLQAGLAVLEEARDELRREGLAQAERVRLGLNLEVPGAALSADLLARQVDFLAIGTNDLVQYLLAVDRGDPRLAALYQPLHPAVLRLIDGVVRAGAAHGVPVSACGEMAGEPHMALVLFGLGLREFSMAPAAIPRIKAVLRAVSASRARELAQQCLALGSAEQIEKRLRDELAAVALSHSGKE